MKKLVIFTILGLMGLSSIAICNTLIQEDFESYSLNSWPSPWIKDANANQSSTNKIVQDPANPSNKVLQIYGSIGGCWAALAYYPCTFPSDFWVNVRVSNGSESLSGCHPSRGSFAMRHGTYWYWETNPSLPFIEFSNSTVNAVDGLMLLPGYQTGQWYDVRIHYERSGDQVTQTYWIDGQNLGQKTVSVSSIPAELPLDHFELNAGEGSVYFDDINVYEAPVILWPNGGERLVAGSQQKIAWKNIAQIGIQDVSIEYSANGGQSWQVIVANTTNDGEFEWTVPAITSDQCLIRISDVADMDAFDISDNSFSIFVCLENISMDFNHDCYVGLADFVEFAAQWLICANPLDPSCLFYTLEKGLLAYYKLDDLTGPVIDETGAYNGTNYGAATGAVGVDGNAYNFDGVNNYVDTIVQANIPPVISVSMWIYPTEEMAGGFQIWGSVENASCCKNGYVANYESNGKFVVFAYVSNNIDRGSVLTANNTVPLNQWSFLTFSVDIANNVKIYVNSVEKGSGSFGASPTSHDRALMIGKSIQSQDLGFKGAIDEVRIYNRALDVTEIHSLYQNP